MNLKFSNTLYNVLRFLTTLFLPAFGALYAGLGTLWGLPAVTQVVGTASLLAVFLGSLMGISRKTYTPQIGSYDGSLVFDEGNINADPLTLHLDASSLSELKGKTEVVLRVRSSS